MSRLAVLKRFQCFCKCRCFVPLFGFDVQFRIFLNYRASYSPSCLLFVAQAYEHACYSAQCHQYSKVKRILPKPRLTNVWHACLKWYAERFPWYAAFPAVPIFFLFIFPDQLLYTVQNMCVCVCVCVCVYAHTHTCDYEEIVPFLPNNTASDTF